MIKTVGELRVKLECETKWTMLNSYAEIRGTLQAIREGVKAIRKCIKLCEEQGLPSESLENVILSVKKDYRRLRLEGFRLWQKLLQIMSEQEILQACETYIAKCFEVKMRHTRR